MGEPRHWQRARGHLQIRARLYGYADIIEAVTARVVHLIARRECQNPTPRTRGLEHDENAQAQWRLVVQAPKNIAYHGRQEAAGDALAMTGPAGLGGARSRLECTDGFVDGVMASCADAIIEALEIASARIVKARSFPIPKTPSACAQRSSCRRLAGDRAHPNNR